MYGNPQRLYVVELAAGVIKVGITSQVKDRRMRAHNGQREFITGKYVTGIEAERELISRMREIGILIRGREWFSGVAFEHAVALAEDVARQYENPAPEFQTHKLRERRSNLSLNDAELALLDAACAITGMDRATFCRTSVLDEIVGRMHGKNFGPVAT